MKVDAPDNAETRTSDDAQRLGRRIRAGLLALVVGAAAVVVASTAFRSEGPTLAPSENGRIVVIAPDDRGILQLVTTDGAGETTQLTQAEGDVLQAEWAADGSAIAYAVVGRAELADVHVMRPDGSDDRVACRACAQVLSVQGEGGPARHVAERGMTAIHVAPNGDYVLVAIPYGDIVIHDSRRAGDPIIVDRPEFGVDDTDFTWSPDGEHLAFASKFPGAADVPRQPERDGIYLVDADGSDLRQIIHPPGPPYTFGPDSQPAWSPDGRSIAFARYVAEFTEGSHLESPGHSEIWVVDVDGTTERQLTTTGGDYGATAPDWSPDASQVAFLYDADTSTQDSGIGETDVGVVDADGSDLRWLFSCLADDSFDRCPSAPDWSPDGSSLTYQGPYGTGPFVLSLEDPRPRGLSELEGDCCVRWQPIPEPSDIN